MLTILTVFIRLTNRLFPTGRAFRGSPVGFKEAIVVALARSEEDFYNEATSVFDEILADNVNFTEEDAAVWERRLAIRANQSVNLELRKQAILRKYSSPGNVLSRQHYLYLEGQLQAAGFNVYVHENRPIAENPNTYTSGLGFTQLGQKQLGQYNLGSSALDVVVNFINEEKDRRFSIGTNYKAVFYVGGQTKGDTANVPIERKDEFRQLILLIKPLHTVGVLLINYT